MRPENTAEFRKYEARKQAALAAAAAGDVTKAIDVYGTLLQDQSVLIKMSMYERDTVMASQLMDEAKEAYTYLVDNVPPGSSDRAGIDSCYYYTYANYLDLQGTLDILESNQYLGAIDHMKRAESLYEHSIQEQKKYLIDQGMKVPPNDYIPGSNDTVDMGTAAFLLSKGQVKRAAALSAFGEGMYKKGAGDLQTASELFEKARTMFTMAADLAEPFYRVWRGEANTYYHPVYMRSFSDISDGYKCAAQAGKCDQACNYDGEIKWLDAERAALDKAKKHLSGYLEDLATRQEMYVDQQLRMCEGQKTNAKIQKEKAAAEYGKSYSLLVISLVAIGSTIILFAVCGWVLHYVNVVGNPIEYGILFVICFVIVAVYMRFGTFDRALEFFERLFRPSASSAQLGTYNDNSGNSSDQARSSSGGAENLRVK